MKCVNCGSTRVATISAHASDMFNVSLNGREHQGYLPDDLGIGAGDDLELDLCLDCGQVQGFWPLETCQLEMNEEEEDDY